ncbi:HAMP domain-containing histidine kinase [Alloscardovia theropitheci]|uniref:histidine kinase n=1 Tax=Alloscardovia theropitheci TaxID=2496842 RepID=A0A4R0QVX9_9BIFI|nr:HAMP domain-containing sensor histidine kinase [Alloscardovia theropitheci]TCD53620.1 HAMP domain-containing histidine kinase [Alloscardovia theropitheci]
MKNSVPQRKGWTKISWRISAIPLATRIVAVVLLFLFVASSVLVVASRQLVSTALMDKTDTQLIRQATLVVNNTELLQSENSENSNKQQQADNSSLMRNMLESGSPNGDAQDQPERRPEPYSTTGNQNLGPADYFVQVRDENDKIVSTPLIPIARDGVEATPDLPAEGKSASFGFDTPTTVSAVVHTANGVLLNDRDSSIAYSPWRVIATRYINRSTGEQYVVYIGLSLFDVNDTTEALTIYFVCTAIAIVISAGFLAFLAVRRSLKPLKRIEQTAAKIAAGDLSQRVSPMPANTEVGSLAASLNTMLSRIERSFKKQEEITNQMKRFVSDASHELRTPLAVIHGSTELYKMQRNSPATDPVENADMVIDHIDKSSSRMSALVEDLLSLARLDEGRGIDLAQTIHVKDMLNDSVEDLHALNPERKISVGRLSIDAGSILQSVQQEMLGEDSHDSLVFVEGQIPRIDVGGDPIRMRQVMTNIIGNIHRYTPSDSPVEVGASVVYADVDSRDFANMPSTVESLNTFLDAVSTTSHARNSLEYVIIRIIDHGPGVAEASRDKIFERFYTADPSRARDKGGTGLGMSIAQSVVKAHHGLICATETPGGGLTYTIVIPISQTALFIDDDPVEERSRTRNTSPAIFGKRKRKNNDDMATTQIKISLDSKNNSQKRK